MTLSRTQPSVSKGAATPSVPQLKRAAQAASAAGRHVEAIQLYRSLLAAKPEDWQAVDHLGDAFAGIRDLTRAVEHYRLAADHYESIQHPQMAIALWAKMVRLFPKMLDFHVKLAALHEQAGHPADAVSEYEAVIEGIRKDYKGLLGETLASSYETRVAALRDGRPLAENRDGVASASVAVLLTPAIGSVPAGNSDVRSDVKRCPHCRGLLP